MFEVFFSFFIEPWLELIAPGYYNFHSYPNRWGSLEPLYDIDIKNHIEELRQAIIRVTHSPYDSVKQRYHQLFRIREMEERKKEAEVELDLRARKLKRRKK